MLKRFFLIPLLLIFFSCNDSAWVREIQDQVDLYNRTIKEEEIYEIETHSLTYISVTKYAERYGIEKILARHQYDGFMNFERHFFLKDNEIIFTHYIGVSPAISGSEQTDFLIFNKQSFWQEANKGYILKQQVLSDVFKNKDEALEILESADVVEERLDIQDYNKIQKDFEEIISLERRK